MKSLRISDTGYLFYFLTKRADLDSLKNRDHFSDVILIPGDRRVETTLDFDGKLYILEFTAYTSHTPDMLALESRLDQAKLGKFRVLNGAYKNKFSKLTVDSPRIGSFYLRIGENSEYSYGLSIKGKPGDYSVGLFSGNNGTSTQDILNKWEFVRNTTTLEEIANYFFQPFLSGTEISDHTYPINLQLED